MAILRRREDARAVWFAVLWVVLVRYHWYAVSASVHGVCLFVLNVLSTFQGGVVLHNAAHTPVFVTNACNVAFFCVLTLWQGAPASSYVPGHNVSHHCHLQTERDVLRTSRVAYRNQALNLLLFFPTVLPGILRNDATFMRAKQREGHPLFARYIVESLLYNSFLLLVLVANWRRALLVFVLPSVVAKDMLVTLNLFQHDGCDPSHRYNHSRNFTDPLLNYFFFNNGYHAIHHASPGLHWSELKRKHEALIAPHIHPGLLESSMVTYIARGWSPWSRRTMYDGTAWTLDTQPKGDAAN